jgi:hypothetical protein
MKPYETIRLTECPDVGDIQSEGRASHVGKLREIGGDFKPYLRTPKRKATRRGLKRADKARSLRDLMKGSGDVDNCHHIWRDVTDSQFSNEHSSDVVCTLCGCPGERDNETGEVFWPAT